MDQFPQSFPEQAPERILSREEILQMILSLAPDARVTKEMSDAHGPYVLEARIEGENGKYIQYEYVRKGNYEPGLLARRTEICVAYYDASGFNEYADQILIYDPQTGELRAPRSTKEDTSDAKNVEQFDIEKSPMKEAYLLLGAHAPLELSQFYDEIDQELMHSGKWDYDNPDLIVTRIKDILEVVDPQTLSEDERVWRQEILWFWYHHAISCAIWKYKDKEAAMMYATKALEFQSEGHPNQITTLLNLLINDKLQEAEEWAESIEDGVEKESAADLIKEYKERRFF